MNHSHCWTMADLVAPGLALGLAFGWAACLMGGCAYGSVGDSALDLYLPDLYGVEAPRFATQVAGLTLSLVLLVIFWSQRRRLPFAGASLPCLFCSTFPGSFSSSLPGAMKPSMWEP